MAADPRRAPAGDEAASLLYARHYERVYGYCLYKLGSREEAEDAAQTAFLYALRGLRRGVVPVVELNWLLTIAKNVCLAGYRTRGRRRRLEVLSDPQVLADAASVDDASDASVLRLEEALARIPEQQRRAILLREWRGLSYREIAEELGLTLAAVETLIFRARRSLAEVLGEESKGSRRRLTGILDLGGLAAAAKSVLGGASAVKVAAGVAAVTAALVAGPAAAPPDDARPLSSVSPPAPAEPAAGPEPLVPRAVPALEEAGRRAAARPKPGEARRAGNAARPKSRRATPSAAPAPATPEPAPAPGEIVGGTTESVEGAVDTASGTVEGAVETVAGTVDSVADEAGIPLPEVGGATDDLTDDVGGIVDGLTSVSAP